MSKNLSALPADTTALIAGGGALPIEIARRLAERGDAPVVLSLRDDSEVFRGISRAFVRLPYPSLSRAIREIKHHGAQNVIMAGLIPKKLIYLRALFDPLVLKLLARTTRNDHALLAEIVEVFERAGLAVLPYWQVLPEYMAQAGQLGHRLPTERERRDFEYGASVLKVTLPCSFGQALVVAEGAVVAIEAMEGTDAMLERAGAIVKKGVLVKMMRVDQDHRYDLPTVGPRTIEHMARSGLTCLAVEARRTLVLDAAATLKIAERNDIALWGLPCQLS